MEDGYTPTFPESVDPGQKIADAGSKDKPPCRKASARQRLNTKMIFNPPAARGDVNCVGFI
jgi:hypothetical protein